MWKTLKSEKNRVGGKEIGTYLFGVEKQRVDRGKDVKETPSSVRREASIFSVFIIGTFWSAV